MNTNHSKQNQVADSERNASSKSTSKEANSKILKPDSEKEKSTHKEKFEGTLRHKEGNTGK